MLWQKIFLLQYNYKQKMTIMTLFNSEHFFYSFYNLVQVKLIAWPKFGGLGLVYPENNQWRFSVAGNELPTGREINYFFFS